ncbi:hypothetical protein LSAT2_025235 [Lamellibrachia satsuma]|nr:hypothetical protein LSAT2_025235 [Lamellibrachia satsuma]
MNHLLSSEVSLDHRELVKKVAQVLKDDPLKVITILHETQDPELVVIVSSECKFHQVFPAEMRALSWVLRQAKCPVTNIDLSRCRLDAGLAKQLSDGLSKNTSIKSLDLSNCNLDADTVKELGVGMAANTSTQSLK